MPASIAPHVLSDILRHIKNVEGWLTEREVRFLATAAANPTAEGSIVELGSYKGKSAIVLAKAARLAGDTHFATVDPFPDDMRAGLDVNLRRAGVSDRVEVFQMPSDDFVQLWDRPIRLLFHDGSNQTDCVRRDVTGLKWHFADGAIIAFHDVLNTSGYRAQVFLDEILKSDNFGPVGFCGSIGWGQYFSDRSIGARYRDQRRRFRKQLTRLMPFLGKSLGGFDKLRYKLQRFRIPHHQIDSARWLRSAA